MANTIQLKRETVAGQAPTNEQVSQGELVINVADGLIFYGDVNGNKANLSDTYSIKAGNTSLVTTGTVTNGTWNSSFGSSAYASTSAKGVASFSSDNFAVSSGVVTIKDGGLATAEIADDAVTAAKLANTAVTAGSYTLASITVDAQGRLTAASSGSASGGDDNESSFKTFSVSGQSDVVADADADTMTFAAAGGMTITTNASSDTITFSSADTNTTYSAGTGLSLSTNTFNVDAAQSGITSLGTLTSLTVDDITINGSTISDGGDFTLDVEGDITVDANGGQIYFKDNGTTYWTFDHGSNDLRLTTAGSNFEIQNSGTMLIDSAGNFEVDSEGDIILDAAGDDIFFKDAGSERFRMDLDSTPTLAVTGAFDIDCNNTITLDGTGGIFMKEGGANTVLIRPTTMNGKGTILKSSNVQYYHASTDNQAFTANAANVGDANTNVRFLPFNTHADHASADEPEHCFQAPCNGHVIAVLVTSNNNLVKPFDPEQGLTAWQSHMQILTRDGAGGANIFGGSVDSGDSRVTGTNTSVTEIDALGHTNGEYQEAIFPFGGTDIFPLVKGNHYAFVMRYSKMNYTEGAPTPNGTTSKNQTFHLTYIISWDETTTSSTLGDWSGY